MLNGGVGAGVGVLRAAAGLEIYKITRKPANIFDDT
jgi:hypothetical protein